LDPQWNRRHSKKVKLDEIKPKLTPEQVLAINLVCNLHDRRSLNTKLKALNLSSAIWNGWLRQKFFSEYFRSQLARRFNNVDTDAQISLASNVQAGDLQSIKYYHELTGIYRPENELNRSLSSVLASLMEILAKYVTSEALVRIADEFERTLTGASTHSLPGPPIEITDLIPDVEFTEVPKGLEMAGPVGSVKVVSPAPGQTNSKPGQLKFEF
jgi:hypothetical protein